jgi:hypothetical protein
MAAATATAAEAPLASTGAGSDGLLETVAIRDQSIVPPVPLPIAPPVVACSETLPPLPSTRAVTEPAPRSPPVPAIAVASPTLAAGTVKLTRSIGAPAVPTRSERKRGIVIWKSTRALALSGPTPLTKADSALAPIGAASTATSATWPRFLSRDLLIGELLLEGWMGS